MSAGRVLVVISANTEWQVVLRYYPGCELQNAGPNPWFEQMVGGKNVIFFHGGWGKISAAATTQFALDRWKPDLLINLGTCGGFAGGIQPGEIILVDETVVYDIYERMGNSQEALDFYSTQLDLSLISTSSLASIRRARLISADRDIDPEEVTALKQRYNAVAADWESGAIAWVAARNKTSCLILRGVSDLVDESGGEAYGQWDLFVERTHAVMAALLDRLPEWLQGLS